MYALRTCYINSWEERATLPAEVPGSQLHEDLACLVALGETLGFDQELTWMATAGVTPIFAERRTLYCRHLPQSRAYEWRWETDLVAYVGLGSSNLAPRRLKKGEEIREKCVFTVFDLSDTWIERPL